MQTLTFFCSSACSAKLMSEEAWELLIHLKNDLARHPQHNVKVCSILNSGYRFCIKFLCVLCKKPDFLSHNCICCNLTIATLNLAVWLYFKCDSHNYNFYFSLWGRIKLPQIVLNDPKGQIISDQHSHRGILYSTVCSSTSYTVPKVIVNESTGIWPLCGLQLLAPNSLWMMEAVKKTHY